MPRKDLVSPRGGTAVLWASRNPVLALQELGVETDTKKMKVGDGVTPWNDLPYMTGPVDGNNVSLQVARGTAAERAATNPVLADGEPAFETDTGIMKIGDGVTAYNSLDYVGTESFSGSEIDTLLTTVNSSNISATHKITRSATLVIAASDSSAKSKAQADYVCDGTNDEVSILSAVSALPETGGKIIFLRGTYNIQSDCIFTTDYLTLEGEGYSTIFSISNTAKFYFSGVNYLNLKNFKVDGNAHTGSGLYFHDGCAFVNVTNVWVKDSSDHSFYLYDIHDFVISGCIAEGGYDDGFACAADQCYRGSIIGCIAHDMFAGTGSSNGIELDDGAHDITVTGCISYNNAGDNGIDVHSHMDYPAPCCYNITIANNVLVGDRITIMGTGVTDVETSYPRDIVVTGNTIYESYIAVDKCHRINVCDNTVRDGVYGISVGAGADNVQVDNNSIFNTSSASGDVGSILSLGDNVQITNNSIDTSASKGIVIVTGTGIQVLDNKISNTVGDGICTYTDPTDVLISRNRLDGDIRILHGTDVVVQNNYVNGANIYAPVQCTIQENYVTDGSIIPTAAGTKIEGNTTVRGNILVTANYPMRIINNEIKSPVGAGLDIRNITSPGMIIHGNYVESSGESGIYLDAVNLAQITGNYVYNSTYNGIAIVGCSKLKLDENTIIDSYPAGGGSSFAGIRISSTSDKIIMQGNKINITNTASFAKYGINIESGCTNTIIRTNDLFEAGRTANILNAGTGTVISNNFGYVSENTGTATIPASGTSIAVNHGLATTPTNVIVTPRGDIGYCWADNFTTTQFTIHCSAAPASDTVVGWSAVV